VAVAAAGNRAAGALAALGAAVWFDFFFTLPYYRLTIRSSDDLVTAMLLLVTGLAVSQIAAWARRLKVIAVADERYLDTMHGTAAKAHSARSPEEVADYVGTLLAGLLDLQDWRFEYGSLRSHPPSLNADGSVTEGDRTWELDQAGLPTDLELRVSGRGQYYGRFLLTPRAGSKPPLQRGLSPSRGRAGWACLQRQRLGAECPLKHDGSCRARGNASMNDRSWLARPARLSNRRAL
jgi:hypothetical protein